jgi:hypothetical protein
MCTSACNAPRDLIFFSLFECGVAGERNHFRAGFESVDVQIKHQRMRELITLRKSYKEKRSVDKPLECACSEQKVP